MKSSKFKTLGIILAVLIIIFGGIMTYASSKLNSEEIRKLAISQTQKIFPNANVQLEDVAIKWGLNFSIELKKFSLSTQDKNQTPIEMVFVDSLDVKIPLWAIITDGGVIEIQLDKPLVNYHEFNNTNNWTYALGDKKTSEASKDSTQEEVTTEEQSSVNSLIEKSKVNVRVTDVLIKYFLKDKSSGQIAISRFLIKGLNLKESTAFEIATDAKIKMTQESLMTVSALAIGEVNLAEYIKNKELSSKVILKINNFKKSDLAINVPEIVTNLYLKLDKDQNISGNIESSFEGRNKIKSDFNVAGKIDLKNIDIDLALKDIQEIIGLDKKIDLSKAHFIAKGNLIFNEDKSLNADLNFNVNPAIGFNVDGIETQTTATGNLLRDNLNFKSNTKIFKGDIDTSLTANLDLNKISDISKMKPFILDVNAKKLIITEEYIQKTLWGSKNKTESKKDTPSKDLETVKNSETKLPNGTINLRWSELVVANEHFNGNGKVIVGGNTIDLNKLDFNFSKGSGSLTQKLKLNKDSNVSDFNLSIKELNLESFKGFLPPFIENFTGMFSGKVDGRATMFNTNKAPTFNINANLHAKKGEIKNINLKDFVLPLVDSIPVLAKAIDQKDLDIDGKFDDLILNGQFTPSAYTLNSIKFISKNNIAVVNGRGKIAPMGESVLDVDFQENRKFGDKVKQNIGTNVIPMRLAGNGFGLKPDSGYTLSKIANTAAKTKGVEALEKVIDKNLNKIVPENAQEKVKGLIDGLLKKNK